MASISPNGATPQTSDHCLWRDHPATPAQLKLFNSNKPPRRATQADVIHILHRSGRDKVEPVPLPEILGLGISQYSARIEELLLRGFAISSETTGTTEEIIHSAIFYREVVR